MPPKPAMSFKNRSSKNKKTISVSRVPSTLIADTNSASGLDIEVEDRFELELCWCIQQLETTLASSKLQEKQMQDMNKHIHSLKNNAVPLIKKRQIMRNTLGDYREKMTEDERKFSKATSSIKFTSVASAKKKSVFLKKATQHTVQNLKENILVDTKQTVINSNKTHTPFQFNFQKCQ